MLLPGEIMPTDGSENTDGSDGDSSDNNSGAIIDDVPFVGTSSLLVVVSSSPTTDSTSGLSAGEGVSPLYSTPDDGLSNNFALGGKEFVAASDGDLE